VQLILNRTKPAIICTLCGLSETCLPRNVSRIHIAELERHIHQIGPLHRGEYLFRTGNPSNELLIVQSGCFKLYGVDTIGREYIPGFRLPGDVLGLHGFKSGLQRYNAIALTNSMVCRISANRLSELVGSIPGLLPALLHLFAQDVISHVFLSGSLSAEERVAAFLSNLEDRMQLSTHAGELHLPMSRSDIAVYLRLAGATVSRILSRLEREGIIACDSRDIHILNQERLNLLCENVPFTLN
jgi:CRP/FNR family transcriptional regulator, anaerobic regulatory protein